MTTDSQDTETNTKVITKLAICLWKLDDESKPEDNFKAVDKNTQSAFKKKARKLQKLLEARDLVLAAKT